LHDAASRFLDEHDNPDRASRERGQAEHERKAAARERVLSEQRDRSR
jgi:hypothetical protein